MWTVWRLPRCISIDICSIINQSSSFCSKRAALAPSAGRKLYFPICLGVPGENLFHHFLNEACLHLPFMAAALTDPSRLEEREQQAGWKNTVAGTSDVAMVMRGKRHQIHCSSWVVNCKGEWWPRIRLPHFQRSTHTKVISMKVKIKRNNDATQHENQTCLILSKIKAVTDKWSYKERIKKKNIGQIYLLENLLSVLPFAK